MTDIKEEVVEEEELEINLRQRVRLFDLSEDGTWLDIGIGEISVYYLEKINQTFLLVHAESDGSLLLESRIQRETAYRKQQERFIIWTENNQVLGLSFQESDGCTDVWEIICQVQGKNPYLKIAQDIAIKVEDIKKEVDDAELSVIQEKVPVERIKVEEPDEDAREIWFEEMLDIEHVVLSSYERDVLEQLIEFVNRLVSPAPEDKIPSPDESRLLDLFHITEDIEETEGLQQLRETILYLLSLRNRQ